MAATAWLPISRGDALPENALAVGTYGVDGMVYVPLSESSLCGFRASEFQVVGIRSGIHYDDDDYSDDFGYHYCRTRYYSDDKILTTFAIL